MYPVTSIFGPALRASHTVVVRVDAYYAGTLLLQDLPITGGTVTVNSGTGVRRTLDVTIADESLWPQLDVIGIELRPYRGVRYPSGAAELVPLGVFCVDSTSMRVRPGSGIQVRAAPDRWARVQRAQFETPQASVRGNMIRQEIIRLVTAAVPGITVTDTTTATTLVTPLVWDRDRAGTAADLATAIAAEVYFDVDGGLVLEPAPLLSQVPVWTVDASANGILLDGDIARDRSRTYNVVVASMGAVDGRTPFAPQIAADTDPTSRTWVDGPFGRVPYYYSSPNLHTTAQALAAAKALLAKVKAINAQLSVESVVHPGLDRGDVMTVLTPAGILERHLIDSLTVPLEVGGVQRITARSSRPDGDIPEGE
ncbi:hypothetical protein GCM10010435_44500 [Winogradskya consettensis]|uniref:DUF5047 domain-containing protein n=1 Tax=Winogradskya consettensis TaxID=113560 RepID=A0A919W697_9ACTN|nr:DUF5047 domain-containing protein [Actinoplanes consettensis]GIM82712.1 hypothetical protein Aco04nite_82890 [Actinoplanes consettensis]